MIARVARRRRDGAASASSCPVAGAARPPRRRSRVTGPDAPASLRFWVTRPVPGGVARALAMTASMATGASRHARSRHDDRLPPHPRDHALPAGGGAARARGPEAGRDACGLRHGLGDDVPAALEQMGYQVTLLTDEDIESGSRSPAYDAIVTGVRAYNTRPRLRAMQERLLDYVAGGGHARGPVQHGRGLASGPARPVSRSQISRDRVTVEDAPVRFARPSTRSSQRPTGSARPTSRDGSRSAASTSRIRGIAKYEAPLVDERPGRAADAAEACSCARHGKGMFIYTGYRVVPPAPGRRARGLPAVRQPGERPGADGGART